jgi:hypothetical protein
MTEMNMENVLIILIIIFLGFIVLKKFGVINKTRGFLRGYICKGVEEELKRKEEEKIEKMSIFDKLENFTIPSWTDITGKINSFASGKKAITAVQEVGKKETFDEVAKVNEPEKAGEVPIPEPLYTLEQVDKDESNVTKYIREIGLGARHACPTNEGEVIPKSEYVGDWLGFSNKINKDSNQYIDMVDKINKMYVMSNNEMPEFSGYKIEDKYDDLTGTNKGAFEKAYLDGKMDTFGTYNWYRDPKVVNKLIDTFGNPSGNLV